VELVNTINHPKMKVKNFSALLIPVLLLAVITSANAQFDDVYFDPSKDAPSQSARNIRSTRSEAPDRGSESANANSGNYAFDDSTYGFDDESAPPSALEEQYDYYYTSRIRRFNRPYYGFDYFDPIYVDAYYYDPFLNPGATVLIYDNFNSFSAYNSWRRWNRWNRVDNFSTWGLSPYTPFYNTWGFNRQVNPYASPFNSWDPWLGSSFSNNVYVNNFYGVNSGFVSNYYCPPAWGAGNVYNTVNASNNSNTNTNGTYYGPRGSGVTPNPQGNGRTRIGALEAPAAANPALDKSRTAPTGTREVPAERTRSYGNPSSSETTRNTTPSGVTTPARTRETAPARSYDRPTTPTRTYDTPPRTTPAATPRVTPAATPRATPAPTRTYDQPRTSPAPSTRSIDTPRNYNTPAPSRTYEAPSRSYEAPAPSRSFDSGSSSGRSSGSAAPASSSGGASRTRGN
jgi:hypothetical protein